MHALKTVAHRSGVCTTDVVKCTKAPNAPNFVILLPITETIEIMQYEDNEARIWQL